MRIPWLASALQDLRHGSVLLWRDAGVSSLIVAVLALGLGGTAAIFTLLKAAFLDPLPYRDAERLVTITDDHGWSASASEFVEIRNRSRTLEQMAFAEHRDMQISGTEGPVRVFAARVTSSFFPLLGVKALLGRTLIEEDNQPGRTPTVLVSHAFWRSHMGADRGVVGRTLRLDSQPALVVGVLPPGFQFDYPTLRISEPVDIYVSYPIAASAPFQRGGAGEPARVLGRLRKGVTYARAESELQSIAEALISEHPSAYRTRDGGPGRFSFEMLPMREAIVGTQRSLLWLLLGGAGILLVIACANTAQLLLARSLRRGREVAIRAALGAGRARLIRQFLLEGVVLSACGGAAGLLLAGWIVRILVRMLPERSPIFESARVDARAAVCMLVLSMLSALIFSIIPAVKGTMWTLSPSLGARTVGQGSRWRHAMISLEAALSVFLLCGAGLVAHNLRTLISTPMGFDPNHVLVMRLKEPPWRPNASDPKAKVRFQEYLAKIAAVPGVDSAATVTGPPLRPSVSGPTELVGVTARDGTLKSVIADNHLVSPDYFRTLRIPLLAGRMFRDDESMEPWRAAIVNAEFARRFGLGRDVVGKQIFEPGQPMTIVGMVGNVRTRGLQSAPFPEVYLPSLRFSWTDQYLVVRSSIPPAQLVKVVRAAIQSLNSEQVVFDVLTMDELITGSVTEPRFDTFLIGAFALLALAMAAAGMYSVISFLVSQRTAEIAIRMALGAGRGAIARTVLATTGLWVAAGLAGGLALGVAASKTIRSLTDTEATASPEMYAAVILFFLAVTLVAASVPLRRALRLDPAAALRCE